MQPGGGRCPVGPPGEVLRVVRSSGKRGRQALSGSGGLLPRQCFRSNLDGLVKRPPLPSLPSVWTRFADGKVKLTTSVFFILSCCSDAAEVWSSSRGVYVLGAASLCKSLYLSLNTSSLLGCVCSAWLFSFCESELVLLLFIAWTGSTDPWCLSQRVLRVVAHGMGIIWHPSVLNVAEGGRQDLILFHPEMLERGNVVTWFSFDYDIRSKLRHLTVEEASDLRSLF